MKTSLTTIHEPLISPAHTWAKRGVQGSAIRAACDSIFLPKYPGLELEFALLAEESEIKTPILRWKIWTITLIEASTRRFIRLDESLYRVIWFQAVTTERVVAWQKDLLRNFLTNHHFQPLYPGARLVRVSSLRNAFADFLVYHVVE